jgi:hypothetical protein
MARNSLEDGPDAAERPAPERMIMFLAEPRAALNAALSDTGVIVNCGG